VVSVISTALASSWTSVREDELLAVSEASLDFAQAGGRCPISCTRSVPPAADVSPAQLLAYDDFVAREFRHVGAEGRVLTAYQDGYDVVAPRAVPASRICSVSEDAQPEAQLAPAGMVVLHALAAPPPDGELPSMRLSQLCDGCSSTMEGHGGWHSRCLSVCYCSRECERKHRREHELACAPPADRDEVEAFLACTRSHGLLEQLAAIKDYAIMYDVHHEGNCFVLTRIEGPSPLSDELSIEFRHSVRAYTLFLARVDHGEPPSRGCLVHGQLCLAHVGEIDDEQPVRRLVRFRHRPSIVHELVTTCISVFGSHANMLRYFTEPLSTVLVVVPSHGRLCALSTDERVRGSLGRPVPK
jgi:hypothetical protein